MPEKILIIDDDLDTLRLVGLMLHKKGYEIAAANNGKQGLLKVVDENPDLILLDVMMPEMDGYEVARRLRQNPKTAGIPILMFTAKSQLDDKVTGFEAGADDYLTKPTHPAELQAHVKALLSRSVKVDKEKLDSVDKKTFTIGVIGARGGLGVSSIALNLGSFLSANIEKKTIVTELYQGKGTMGRDLDFEGFGDVVKLLKNVPEEITKEDVEKSLFEHETGLLLLPASEAPKDAVFNNTESQNKAICSHLSSLAHFLIIDFGTGLPKLSQSLLSLCDQIIIVVEAFSNSMAQSKILLENLIDLGVPRESILVALNNRMRSDLLLSRSQVEKGMDFPVGIAFTPAPELFSQATRKKTTAVIEDPDSMTTQQFQKMAKIIIKNEAEER